MTRDENKTWVGLPYLAGPNETFFMDGEWRTTKPYYSHGALGLDFGVTAKKHVFIYYIYINFIVSGYWKQHPGSL